MSKEQITKIKRRILRLNQGEALEIEKYARKIYQKRSLEEHDRKAAAHEQHIRSLPAGTKVIVGDAYSALAGKILEIVRHQRPYKGRLQTIVRLEDGNLWRYPSRMLTDNLARLGSINESINLSKILNEALSKITN